MGTPPKVKHKNMKFILYVVHGKKGGELKPEKLLWPDDKEKALLFGTQQTPAKYNVLVTDIFRGI